MQTSDPRHEWYELDVSAPTGNGAKPKISRVRTLLSVALCVMASYMAGGVIAADSASAPAGVTIPDQPQEATFVMSWYDDEDHDDGCRDYTVETEAPETDADTDAGSDRIAKLAEQYIADHTP